MDIDIKKLQVFVAIAEECSFTAASERLRQAQPWISVQLRLLEEQLGLVLVERSRGKFTQLSPDGCDLLPIATKLLDSCNEASQTITAIGRRSRARLVLGVDPITLYIPERNQLITHFMTKMRDTDLEIASHPPSELYDGLRNGRFEMILTSCPNPGPDIEFLPLYKYNLELFVPRKNTRPYNVTSFSDLAGAKMLTLRTSYHPPIYSWLQSAVNEPMGFDCVTCPETSFHALIRYAALLGIATMVPDFSASIADLRTELELKRLTGKPPLAIEWGLLRRRGFHGRAAQALWSMAASSRRNPAEEAA